MHRGGMRGIRPVPNTGIILSDSILNGAPTRSARTMTRIFITATITARGEVGIEDSRALTPKAAPDFIPKEAAPGFIPKEALRGTIPRELALRATILRELALPAIVLKGVPVPFRGIVLKGVLFRGTIPREVALRDIILREAQLPGTIPREVALRDIILREAQLPGTIPREVALRDIILREAHLLNISLPLPAVLNLRHPLLMRNIISRNSPAAARSQIAPPGAIWAFFES